MILDAGVLISIDRGEEQAGATLRAFEQAGERMATTEPVLAQVWRDGARQARLARALQEVEIRPFTEGRRVGLLLGASGTRDVVDAHLVLVAVQTGEAILTGDPDDLGRLAATFGERAPVIHPWPVI